MADWCITTDGLYFHPMLILSKYIYNCMNLQFFKIFFINS